MIRLAAIAVAGLFLFGCARTPSAAPERRVEVPEGATVHMVLLDKVESGVSREGDPVRLVVSEPLKVAGEVAVPAGALATARVVWSRRGDPLRMLANQPARLAIAFESVELAGGRRLELDGERFQIERSMVGPQRSEESLARMMDDPAAKSALEELARSLERGALPDSATAREDLRRVASELGLQELQRALGEGEAGRFGDALASLRKAGAAGMLVDGGLGAVLELASLAGSVGDRLSRMLKAPNIVAQPGTPLAAKTGPSQTIVLATTAR